MAGDVLTCHGAQLVLNGVYPPAVLGPVSKLDLLDQRLGSVCFKDFVKSPLGMGIEVVSDQKSPCRRHCTGRSAAIPFPAQSILVRLYRPLT